MIDAMHAVLIVEDDAALQVVLSTLFEANGFRVIVAATAAAGIHDAKLHRPDLVLVDLGLPERDGIEVIVAIRAYSALPIIVLSARTGEAQRVAAFDNGADDSIVKPFSAPELIACVRKMLRSHARGVLPMTVLKLGPTSVDLERRAAQRDDGVEVHLTPIEQRILETLARNSGRIVTYGTLTKAVWGPKREDARALRVYIGSLRRKLEVPPDRPQHILTEMGLGYRLMLD